MVALPSDTALVREIELHDAKMKISLPLSIRRMESLRRRIAELTIAAGNDKRGVRQRQTNPDSARLCLMAECRLEAVIQICRKCTRFQKVFYSSGKDMVGVARFELTTPTSRTWCSTRLSYTPTKAGVYMVAPPGATARRGGVGSARYVRFMQPARPTPIDQPPNEPGPPLEAPLWRPQDRWIPACASSPRAHGCRNLANRPPSEPASPVRA